MHVHRTDRGRSLHLSAFFLWQFCAFTVSNDSIRIYDLPRSRRDYMKRLTHHEKPLRRYPGVLIGRLGVNQPLFQTEEQEFAYTMGKNTTPMKLDTRLMYFDLLKLRQDF